MIADHISDDTKVLSEEESHRLQMQNSRLVPEHKAKMLECEASKHWDLFYKRNENRFFKDRHWTMREFAQVLRCDPDERKVLFEVGCGVGNLIFPLIKELNLFVYACDFSKRAVDLVKGHELYDEGTVCAFQTDITTDHVRSVVEESSVDIVTLVFVLSAIHPEKFCLVVDNVYRVLKPGGILLFRDYGVHDMAQLRFKAGHKIAENFYMRQDGTRSYYFSKEELKTLFLSGGFEEIDINYVHRRTINKKEDIDVPRIFVQAKFQKPNPKKLVNGPTTD